MVTSPPKNRHLQRTGFTLVEVLVTMAVLAVAIGMTVSSITSLSSYGAAARELSLAQGTLFDMVEDLRARPLDQIFADFNENTADDGPEAFGAAFDVAGLNAQDDDPDGRVGRILLPEDPLNSAVLREDLDSPELGLPFDLNVDGVIDAGDHAADYRILPVRIVLEWKGKAGNRRLFADTTLGEWQ